MYSQNCNYLQPNKQPSLNSLNLIPRYARQFGFDGSKKMCVDLKSITGDICPIIVQDTNIDLKDISNSKNITVISNNKKPEGSKHKNSTGIAQYSRVASIPMPHFIGLVANKSQIGRNQDIFSDINDEFIVVGHSSDTCEHLQTTMLIEKTFSTWSETNKNKQPSTSFNCISSMKAIPNDRPNPQNIEQTIKQPNADVIKSCKTEETLVKSVKSTDNYKARPNSNPKDCNRPKHVLEPIKIISEDTCTRNRFTSECSADSEDSFIVFEYCENDPFLDEVSSCSDDEGTSDKEPPSSDFDSLPSRESSFIQYCNPGMKKVRFAKGKKLVQVHPMITWDFAYRSARKGPWETMALDSERFRNRVAKAQEILAPILDPLHRAAVYNLRFSPEVHSATSSYHCSLL